MKMALLSSSPTPTLSHTSSKPHNNLTHKPYHLNPNLLHFKKPGKSTNFSIKVSADNGTGVVSSTPIAEEKVVETTPSDVQVAVKDSPPTAKVEKTEENVGPNEDVAVEEAASVKKYTDPKWVNGTWDLEQFKKNGTTDWDAVIDAEARRRKWLETYPESTSNEEPIIFDTSIIPWWAWIKRFHLPEAEILNGRAAMIGFFMAYFVDSLTGLGVVDQMNNFFCKTLLFIGVLGVLLIRKNGDVDNLKKLIEETTFYDKQWQATWQEESTSTSKRD